MRKLSYPSTNFICVGCNSAFTVLQGGRAKRFVEKGGWRCKSCASKLAHQNMSEDSKLNRRTATLDWLSKRTPEQLSEIGRKRRAKVKLSGAELRARQQATIESDETAYAAYCEKRRIIAQNFHNEMSDADKETYYQNVFKNTGRSKAEDEFFDELTRFDLSFERNKIISGFIVDGIHNKLIVEFYGDTYHCNPKKFTDPSQYCSWIKRTVAEQWKRDQKRLACFYRLGYTVVIVWQSDWIKNKCNVIERIQHALSSC